MEEDVADQLGVAAVGIEIGVKDGDLGADGGRGQVREQVRELACVKSPRCRAVYRRHDGRLEDIHIQMQPVAVKVGGACNAASRVAALATPWRLTSAAGITAPSTRPVSARCSSLSRQPIWTAPSLWKYGPRWSMSATAGQCMPTPAARSSPARLAQAGELPGWRKSVCPST